MQKLNNIKNIVLNEKVEVMTFGELKLNIIDNEYMNVWISIEDAVTYLNVNKDSIRNWIKKAPTKFQLTR